MRRATARGGLSARPNGIGRRGRLVESKIIRITIKVSINAVSLSPMPVSPNAALAAAAAIPMGDSARSGATSLSVN